MTTRSPSTLEKLMSRCCDVGIDFRNRLQWATFTFLVLMNITMMAIFMVGLDSIDTLIVFIVLVDALALITFGLSTFVNKYQNNLHIVALLLSITNISISGIRFFLDNWSSDPLVNQIGSSCEDKNSVTDCAKFRLLFFGFTLFLISNFGILLVLGLGKWSLIEHYEPIERKKGYGALLNEDEPEDIPEEEDLSNRPYVEYEENV